MAELMLIVLAAALVNNFVLVQFLGLCPFMGASRRVEGAVGMGLATGLVLTTASGLSFLVDRFLLQPFDLQYLRLLSFILVIGVAVQLTDILIRRFSPLLHRLLGIYVPLIASNCAVLGVALLNSAASRSFVAACSTAQAQRSVLLSRSRCSRGCASGSHTRTCRSRSAARQSRSSRPASCRSPFSASRASPASRMFSAVLILAGLALALTTLLIAAARLLPSGDDDGAVGDVEKLLPRIQCAQCGYPGCRPYAAAIVSGAADINRCPPGGADTIARLATLLGRDPMPLDATCGAASIARVALIDEAGVHRLQPVRACVPRRRDRRRPAGDAHGARRTLHGLRALPRALPGGLHRDGDPTWLTTSSSGI